MVTKLIGGYRFVPLADRVVEPPLTYEDLDIGRPHKGGSVSGTLKVRWTVSTPLCVGETGDDGVVRPMMLGREAVLPGATLKGMIRAVLEIATFSGLGGIDSHRHYGFRHIGSREEPHRRAEGNAVHAGWLSREPRTGQDGIERPRWVFKRTGGSPGSFYKIPFSEIVPIGRCRTPEDWKVLGTREKVELLAAEGADWLKNFRVSAMAGAQPGLGGDLGKVSRETGPRYDAIGHLVAGGPCPAEIKTNAKANEHVFPPPRGDGVVLRDDFVELFSQMHSNPGRDRPEPRGAWRFWLVQTDYYRQDDNPRFMLEPDEGEHLIERYRPPGIPIFFHGDPREAADGSDAPVGKIGFCIGLSRVLRFPYRLGLGDVAANSGISAYRRSHDAPGASAYRVPGLLEPGFDFARAMFGDLDQIDVPDGADPETKRTLKESARALASRVRFSCGYSGPDPELTDERSIVFGTPRPSFWRAYLAQDGDRRVDYDDDGARLAGRKRYPVRKSPNPGVPPNDNLATQTRIHFLQAGTIFESRIKFHNLHPVELGALIWALRFGELNNGGRFRHACGRGKAFGFGALQADISFSRPPVVLNFDAAGVKADDMAVWVGLFEDYMTDRLADGGAAHFTKLPEISRLRAMADPAVGHEHRGNLGYPPVEKYKDLQTSGFSDVGEHWRSD